MEQMNSDRRILHQVHKGMPIVDVDNKEIGSVEAVFLGRLGDDMIETGAQGAEAPGLDLDGRDNVVEVLATALVPKEIPEELAKRLAHEGYILMNAAGIFAADRYVLPEQIAGIGIRESRKIGSLANELLLQRIQARRVMCESPRRLTGGDRGRRGSTGGLADHGGRLHDARRAVGDVCLADVATGEEEIAHRPAIERS